jgi:hypothetical protein
MKYNNQQINLMNFTFSCYELEKKKKSKAGSPEESRLKLQNYFFPTVVPVFRLVRCGLNFGDLLCLPTAVE